MSVFSKLSGLIPKRERVRRAKDLLEAVERILRGAADLQEARRRIADGAMRGDLDDVVSWAHDRDKRVRDFIEGR